MIAKAVKSFPLGSSGGGGTPLFDTACCSPDVFTNVTVRVFNVSAHDLRGSLGHLTKYERNCNMLAYEPRSTSASSFIALPNDGRALHTAESVSSAPRTLSQSRTTKKRIRSNSPPKSIKLMHGGAHVSNAQPFTAPEQPDDAKRHRGELPSVETTRFDISMLTVSSDQHRHNGNCPALLCGLRAVNSIFHSHGEPPLFEAKWMK